MTKAWRDNQRINIRRSIKPREGDKGANQRINIRRSIKQGAGFLFCLVSELVELVVKSSGPAKFKKVQMERLQWGFPIATALSLNSGVTINGK